METSALIDTGFDGDLALPATEIGAGATPDDYQIWGLADGSEVAAPVYFGSVQVGSFPPFDADITVVGDEAILGRGVTDHYWLILDHGERVMVEL